MADTDPSELRVLTLGVYGSTEDSFFGALEDEQVDTFVDVRNHRGLRGKRYRYANSTYLQNRLEEMGIRYVHLKALAPTKEIRNKQKQADEEAGVQKRERDDLGEVFVTAYREEILRPYDLGDVFEALPEDASVVALFCVEREPAACHRSLLADRLQEEFGVSVDHLRP